MPERVRVKVDIYYGMITTITPTITIIIGVVVFSIKGVIRTIVVNIRENFIIFNGF